MVYRDDVQSIRHDRPLYLTGTAALPIENDLHFRILGQYIICHDIPTRTLDRAGIDIPGRLGSKYKHSRAWLRSWLYLDCARTRSNELQ